MKIAFDIGGVLTKYPEIFRKIIKALINDGIRVFVITDIPDKQKASDILKKYGYLFFDEDILCADYSKYGEKCKTLLIKEHHIDLLIDDHPGYCEDSGCLSLFVWPNPNLPYDSTIGETSENHTNK